MYNTNQIMEKLRKQALRQSFATFVSIACFLPASANAQLLDSLKELSDKLKSTLNRAIEKSTDEAKQNNFWLKFRVKLSITKEITFYKVWDAVFCVPFFLK